MPASPTPAAIAREWFEQIWINRDPSAIHRLLAPDGKGYLEPDLITTGPEEFQSVFHALTSTFPDMRVTIEAVTGCDKHACVRWTVSGTHSGEALGIASTGRKVSFRGITWFTVTDGKIVEGWDSWNQGALVAALTKV